MKKQLLLTFAGTAALALFFLLPQNNAWLNKRVLAYWNDFLAQRKHRELEYRKIMRYENAYVHSVLITQHLKKKGLRKSTVVLVPSTAYFQKNGIDYPVPEPAVFYYYTGLKTVAPSAIAATEASWFVAARDRQFYIDSFGSRQALLDSIRHFKQFD